MRFGVHVHEVLSRGNGGVLGLFTRLQAGRQRLDHAVVVGLKKEGNGVPVLSGVVDHSVQRGPVFLIRPPEHTRIEDMRG